MTFIKQLLTPGSCIAGEFNSQTHQWLEKFLEGDFDDMKEAKRELSKEIRDELQNIGSKGTQIVYRGIGWMYIEDYQRLFTSPFPKVGDSWTYTDKNISSWSKDLKVAKRFMLALDGVGIVLKFKAKPTDIILDVDAIPPEMYPLTNINKHEREVILSEGTYNCEVVEAEIDD